MIYDPDEHQETYSAPLRAEADSPAMTLLALAAGIAVCALLVTPLALRRANAAPKAALD